MRFHLVQSLGILPDAQGLAIFAFELSAFQVYLHRLKFGLSEFTDSRPIAALLALAIVIVIIVTVRSTIRNLRATG